MKTSVAKRQNQITTSINWFRIKKGLRISRAFFYDFVGNLEYIILALTSLIFNAAILLLLVQMFARISIRIFQHLILKKAPYFGAFIMMYLNLK